MKILETCLYAEDLEAAHRFYVEVLGLPVISYNPDRDLFLRLDDSVLIVFKPSRTIQPDLRIPPHGATGSGHAAFCATEREILGWKVRFAENGIKVISEVGWPNGARSLYIHDPAGNVLEFATPRLWSLS